MIIESKNCRLCGGSISEITYLCDSPPANNFDETFIKNKERQTFPLILDFCSNCCNLQLRHCLGEGLLYSDYTYITPKSPTMDAHYSMLCNYAKENLSKLYSADVVEIGSNSGDLLAFLKPYVLSVLGVDPASNIAKLANGNGIETLNSFFNQDIAEEVTYLKKNIQLVIARHMFAHNSDPSELLRGMKKLINKNGIVMIENAYAIDTLIHGEFDQVYHEHMFFYSVTSMLNLLRIHGLYLNDILFSDVHGGSIVFIASLSKKQKSQILIDQLSKESELFEDGKVFRIFEEKINQVKKYITNKIKDAQKNEKNIIAYGAPAKAFTMFSMLELDNKTIRYCVDTTPTKIGKVFPIFNIPIISEEELQNKDYDVVLVTSWNYKEDILKKSKNIFKPGTTLLFPLPVPTEIIV